MLELFGVSEENWREGASTAPHFLASQSPSSIGGEMILLVLDPEVSRFSGKSLSTWALSDAYGYTDADGTRPHWGNHYKEHAEGGNEQR
ncbi:hypothetical protein [Rossellomorea marisflavi]|uniref:hypothetical protein n=2 Tax=Rossellomorea marisflavi TaxID=189381 RepID=UPI001BC9B4A6|nr:hypothetical protein [Rossellomorea marisflavi]